MFDKLGKFEIKRVLGHGAMGEVYLGVDPAIGREVAIKTILPSAAQGEDAKERFAREAKAAGVLNHPNLVTIYEFGEDQDVLYIAMEFVKGHDLEELFRDQSLTRAEVLEILAQVCDGLGFAHRNHIVHRDIKPSNVRVQRDGRRLLAKVMDFGVARVGNSEMTATGMVMGTVSYMAPEYIKSGKPDPRSDLFAVGVMLYEALSGRKPFAGDTTPTILYRIVHEPPEPIDAEALQGVSPSVRAVLERALVKEPDQRFQTAEDFAKALRAAKDPTWSGQMEEGTTLLRTGANAGAAAMSTAPVATSTPTSAPTLMNVPAAGTQPVPAQGTQAPSRGIGIWLGAAALLLIAGGGGWWWTHRPTAAPQQASLTAPDGTAQTPAGQSPAGGQRPAAQGTGQRPQGAAQMPGQLQPSGGTASAQLQTATKKEAAQAAPPQTGASSPTQQPPKPQGQERFTPENLEKLEVHERSNLGNITLSEAIQSVDKDPARAIEGFRQAIKADPTNANAYAWLGAVLYEQGRYAEFGQTLRQARRAGVLPQMMRNARFASKYRHAQMNNRLPED
ncbi:MAG TPA: protein kinase [Holophagaceae bacterium]|nr:protein kinase [Holophagaceae bacterium]